MKLLITTKSLFYLYREFCSNLNVDHYLFLPCGESSKNFKYVNAGYQTLIKHCYTKSDEIIAMGGGAVTDTSGFIAATFKRGMELTLIPTTYLGMVDASIGGKNGINYLGIKNVIGTYYQPSNIILDHHFLNTLSDLEIYHGLAEVLKLAICADKELFRIFQSNISRILNKRFLIMLARICSRIKNAIVKKDPYDLGERKILNFAHTIGHVLETSYKLPHGEAIFHGILLESRLAFRLGILEKKDHELIKKAARIFPFIEKCSFKINLNKLSQDKKNLPDHLTFCLPTGIGKSVIVSMTMKKFGEIL